MTSVERTLHPDERVIEASVYVDKTHKERPVVLDLGHGRVRFESTGQLQDWALGIVMRADDLPD